MHRHITQRRLTKAEVFTPLVISSIFYAIAVFYFDEGRNSFLGLADPGNLMSLALFKAIMLGFSALIYEILRTILREIFALIATAVFGPPLVFLTLIFTLKLISEIL